MIIFNIAVKEIKNSLRDRRSFLFMLALPIVLMLILGTALSNAFDTTLKVKEIQVLYQDNSTGAFSTYFQKVTEEASKSGITFIQATPDQDGKEEVRQNRYDAFVDIGPNGVQLYGSELTSIESNIIQGMLTTVVDKYNVGSELAKVNPAAMQLLGGGGKQDYIQETSLHTLNKPGAMDYYAIAMTSMITLYGAMFALHLLRGERAAHTADRLIAAPISKAQIFIGKIIGALVIQSLYVIILILFSKYVFHANWGDHVGLVTLVLITQVLLAISCGIGVSYMAKSTGSARSIISTAIQIFSVLGGAYFIFDTSDQIVNIITHLSPITWVRIAVTKIIYTGDLSAAIPAIGFNIAVAVIMILISIVSMRKREGL
ncbi:ABC transporter permease [Paenibacillus sp. KN14-4R]|uniref:ABC transporter permease n=1 Tax=Paenibacillus sp. KN14-4R TaxID=3445773 RepID=UPI003F9EC985